MAKEKKTNAARILDSLGIQYEIHTYPVDENHLEATYVAEEVGKPVERVYKTIVLRGDKTGPIVCVVAADREVNLKLAAKVSGNKSVSPLPLKDLLATTGYIRGGCTAIGMKKKYPVFVSEEMTAHPTIFVSAGQRGMQLELSPADYIRAAEAVPAAITATS